MSAFFWFFICMSYFLISVAYAQTHRNNEENTLPGHDALLRQEKLSEEQLHSLSPDASLLQAAPQKKVIQTLARESPCVVVTDLVFSGESARRFNWLKRNASPYLDRCIGTKGINRIVTALDAQLLESGYITTRISIPHQHISDGTLQLTLHVGRVADIRMENTDSKTAQAAIHSAPWGLWQNAFPVSRGDILNLRNLEQGLEQMKRMHSQTVTNRLIPGERPDTSIVIIERRNTDWHDRIHSGLTLDNSGSRTLSSTQLSAYLTIDNLLGLNDIITINSNINAEHIRPDHRNTGTTISYSIPWGYHTVTISRSKNRFSQLVQGTAVNFLSSGHSTTSKFRWHALLLRSSSFKTGVYASLSTRQAASYLNDLEILVQRRRTTNLETGITFKRISNTGNIEFELGYRRGMPWQGAQKDVDTNIWNSATLRPAIWLFSGKLHAAFSVNNRPFSYTTTLRAQQTRNTTFAADQISIGNRYSVRGFDGEGLLLAENGIIIRNEISSHFRPNNNITAQWFIGLDAGHVWGPAQRVLAGNKLAGAVVGVRGNWKQLSAELALATPVYKPQKFTSNKLNPYLSVTYRF